MNIIGSVISQHAEEAAMLWLLRRGAVNAPHYSLADLAKLDGRVEAHLDGSRIAGEDGWKIHEEQLSFEEDGELFAAGVLAIESGDATRIAKVFDVAQEHPELAGSLVSALGWVEGEKADPLIQRLLASESAAGRLVGIGASAVRRQLLGGALKTALHDSDASVQARACKAIGELARADLLQPAAGSLESDDEELRFWTAWSTVLLAQSEAALGIVRATAESGGRHQGDALQLLLRRMESGTSRIWQRKLAQNPAYVRIAVQTAGIIGDPEFIPWLVEQMKLPAVARVAGEAFTFISGVDIAYEDLEGEWPEGLEAGPTENPEDENVEMDPDEDLPWPDPSLIAKWWEKNRVRFTSGTRYLCGKPITIDSLQQVLRDGYQRQRAAAALELAIRQPGTPLFNVKAPGFRQQQILGKAHGLGR